MAIRTVMTNNSGFSAAVDYFGVEDAVSAKVVSSELGASNSNAEALDSNGDAFAYDTFGNIIAPSGEYKADGEILLSEFPALGSVHTVDEKKVMVTEIAITTEAGTAPTISVSGTQVGYNAEGKRTFPINGGDSGTPLTPKCRVQFPFGGITLTGDGARITTANYTLSCVPDDTTVKGIPIGYCSTNGKVEVELTITAATTEKPTVSSDVFIFGAVNKTNGDAAYTEYTVSGVAYLTAVEVA